MIRRLEKIYAFALVVVFAGIVVHAPFSVYFGTVFPDQALLIKSWKEIVMLLLVPLAIYIVTKHRLWREFSQDWIFRLLIAYALLHVALVGLLYTGAQPTMAGMAIDLRYVLFFGLVYTLIRAAPQYRAVLLRIVVGGAVLVLGFATAQLFLPADLLSHIGYSETTIQPYLTVDKNPDYIRVNSTLRGPNPLGAYAAAALALIAAFVVRQGKQLKDINLRWSIAWLTLLGSVALWVSYSRSSFLALLLALIAVVSLVGIKRIPPRMALIGGVGTAIVVAIALVVAQQTHFISNVILHENPEGGSAVSSNDGHVESLVVGVQRLGEQPFGGGVGSTGSASLFAGDGIIIENQYLFIAHETGWLGLALYIGIFGLLMWRLWGQRRSWLGLGVFAGGLGLAFIGILQPVWVDDTVSMVWWGLTAIAIIGEKTHGRSTTKQKTA